MSPLFERGYTVMPEPQRVALGDGDFRFGEAWRLETGPGLKSGDVAVEALREDLDSRKVRSARNYYDKAHQIAVRDDNLDWLDSKPISGMETGEISLE